jgi:hypothetical protein
VKVDWDCSIHLVGGESTLTVIFCRALSDHWNDVDLLEQVTTTFLKLVEFAAFDEHQQTPGKNEGRDFNFSRKGRQRRGSGLSKLSALDTFPQPSAAKFRFEGAATVTEQSS